MEVDAIQAKGKGKGGKGNKPQCKHCGKSHKGECWAKGQQGSKGKGKGGKDAKGKSKGDNQKGKTQQSPKEPCQICGKAGHGAAKYYQRFKQDKGKIQQTKDSVPSGTGETPSPRGKWCGSNRFEGWLYVPGKLNLPEQHWALPRRIGMAKQGALRGHRCR